MKTRKPKHRTMQILKAQLRPCFALLCSANLLWLASCGAETSSTSTTVQMPPQTTQDITAPVIALNGLRSVSILAGSVYTDPGASATDDTDGDISPQITSTSTVNTAITGTYEVTYRVSDAAGNAASAVTRSVAVEAAENKRQFGPNGFVRITAGENGLPNGIIDPGDRFGRDQDIAGDVDGDGVLDLVIGARSDDDGGVDAGAAYIVFLNADGTVKDHQKISMLAGNFAEILEPGNFFGYGVTGIGDYDGDGIADIAVTAPTPPNQALYIVHLNADGTVKSFVKNAGIPGQGLSAAGDLNGDGRIDLIAADPGAGNGSGGIEILFFDDTSRVIDAQTVRINSIEGGFGTGIEADDSFGGRESAVLGDIDDDGTIEVAIGAFQSNGGLGAIWIISLDETSLMVMDKRKITSGEAGFDEMISAEENSNGTFGGQLGHALAAVGDLNGDGIPDLFTGANQHEEGHAYIFYLNADKTVKTYTRINGTQGGFDLDLIANGRFSRSISAVNPGDGTLMVNVGGDADGSGSVYTLNYQRCTFALQGVDTFWSDGTDLFSNWSHADQLVTSPLTFEQCADQAFAVNGDKMTYSGIDQRCIIKDNAAVLTSSAEGSAAYERACP